MAFEVGQFVTPNIRLVRLLGEGGMGSVWVADHLGLHTEVAVKCLGVELANDPEARARFGREAAAAAQLKSTHVVQTLDHGFLADGSPYIVMEKLEGRDLYARIQDGRVPPDELLPILTQAAKALTAAHAKGIVHRDVKPENIFLAEVDGEIVVKLLDFGIAKVARDGDDIRLTGTGMMVGTAYYMSPEQIRSARDVDAQSDLWSLGVVAYHALTGSRPFDGETVGAVCIEIATGTFPPTSTLGLGLPLGLDGWFQRALARPKSERFATAKEMVQAFAEAIGAPASAVGQTFPASMREVPASLRVPGPRSSAAIADSFDERAGTMHAASFAGAVPSPSDKRRGAVVGVVAAVVLVGAGVAAVVAWPTKPTNGRPADPPPSSAAVRAESPAAAASAAAPPSATVTVEPVASTSASPSATSAAKKPVVPAGPPPTVKTPDAPKIKDRGF